MSARITPQAMILARHTRWTAEEWQQAVDATDGHRLQRPILERLTHPTLGPAKVHDLLAAIATYWAALEGTLEDEASGTAPEDPQPPNAPQRPAQGPGKGQQ